MPVAPASRRPRPWSGCRVRAPARRCAHDRRRFAPVRRSRTERPSIFSLSMEKRHRFERVEKPVPKSSRTRPTPSARSSRHCAASARSSLMSNRLGDFDVQARRRQAALAQHGGHRLGDGFLAQLDRRHVDRDDHRLAPVCRFLAGALQHPLPEREDQAGALRDRHEGARREFAAGRMRPAHERFAPDDRVVGEVDDRLIFDSQAGARATGFRPRDRLRSRLRLSSDAWTLRRTPQTRSCRCAWTAYMARSAQISNCGPLEPCCGYCEIPTLAPMCTSDSWRMNGCASVFTISSAAGGTFS